MKAKNWLAIAGLMALGYYLGRVTRAAPPAPHVQLPPPRPNNLMCRQGASASYIPGTGWRCVTPL